MAVPAGTREPSTETYALIAQRYGISFDDVDAIEDFILNHRMLYATFEHSLIDILIARDVEV